jgi:hypothetical protein
MSDLGYGYIPEDDEDARLGIPSELAQRTMLAEAVVKANNLHLELNGEISGMLAEYVRHALGEASSAAADLLTMHPRDERELFEQQKRAAGYASVMGWIRAVLIAGRNAEEGLNEMEHSSGEED